MPATANVMTSMSRYPGRRRPTCSTISSSAGTRRANAPKPTAHGAATEMTAWTFRRACPRRVARASCRSSAWCIRAAIAMPIPVRRARPTTFPAANGRSSNNISGRSAPRGPRSISRTRRFRSRKSRPRWRQLSGVAWKLWFSFPPNRNTAVRAARLNATARASLRCARRARPPSKLCAGRDCRPRCARPSQSRLRPQQDHAGRRRLRDDRLMQFARKFAFRSYRDECLDLGPASRARAALSIAGRASRPRHGRHRRPRGALPLPGNRPCESPKARRRTTENGRVWRSASIPRRMGHSRRQFGRALPSYM